MKQLICDLLGRKKSLGLSCKVNQGQGYFKLGFSPLTDFETKTSLLHFLASL